MIWLSADLHFGHNKPFIYEKRGFNDIHEMNETILNNFRSVVKPEDDLYLLGDLYLGSLNKVIHYLLGLPGKIHIVYGNHDTLSRQKFYGQMPNVVEVMGYSNILKYNKQSIYLSHYPTITDNYPGFPKVINFFGHTHQKTNQYRDYTQMYHVGVDSHNCFPVNIDEALSEIKSFKQG